MFGLIGKKIGMTQIFDATGRLVPVTVIEIHSNVVVAKKTVEKDGYNAVVLGVDEKKKSRVTALRGSVRGRPGSRQDPPRDARLWQGSRGRRKDRGRGLRGTALRGCPGRF